MSNRRREPKAGPLSNHHVFAWLSQPALGWKRMLMPSETNPRPFDRPSSGSKRPAADSESLTKGTGVTSNPAHTIKTHGAQVSPGRRARRPVRRPRPPEAAGSLHLCLPATKTCLGCEPRPDMTPGALECCSCPTVACSTRKGRNLTSHLNSSVMDGKGSAERLPRTYQV